MTAGLPSHHESRFLTPPSPWRPWCSAIFICWLQPVVASAPLFCLLREGKGKLQVYYNCMNVQFPPLAPTKSWRMFWFRRGGTTESDPPHPNQKTPHTICKQENTWQDEISARSGNFVCRRRPPPAQLCLLSGHSMDATDPIWRHCEGMSMKHAFTSRAHNRILQ